VLDSAAFEAAVGAALAEVAQAHGAVVMDWLGVINYGEIEGERTSDKVLFVDSDMKITQALGLGSLLTGWLDDLRAQVLYGGDDDDA
jgi:hypothetical protein